MREVVHPSDVYGDGEFLLFRVPITGEWIMYTVIKWRYRPMGMEVKTTAPYGMKHMRRLR